MLPLLVAIGTFLSDLATGAARSERMDHSRPGAVVLCVGLLFTACAKGSPTAAPTSAVGPGEAQLGPAAPSTTSPTAPLDAEGDHGQYIGEVPAQRAEDLGLAVDLTPQLWADAEAVAAHFVLADTTYEAVEDPSDVNARRASYATPPLAAEIMGSSGGATRLAELRRRQVGFVGQVSAITTSEASGRLAMVNIVARVTVTAADQAPSIEVHFYDLTLVYDGALGRWLVAGASRS